MTDIERLSKIKKNILVMAQSPLINEASMSSLNTLIGAMWTEKVIVLQVGINISLNIVEHAMYMELYLLCKID
jgi:hypothetical protein